MRWFLLFVSFLVVCGGCVHGKPKEKVVFVEKRVHELSQPIVKEEKFWPDDAALVKDIPFRNGIQNKFSNYEDLKPKLVVVRNLDDTLDINLMIGNSMSVTNLWNSVNLEEEIAVFIFAGSKLDFEYLVEASNVYIFTKQGQTSDVVVEATFFNPHPYARRRQMPCSPWVMVKLKKKDLGFRSEYIKFHLLGKEDKYFYVE